MTKTTKKLIFIILITVFVFTVVSCADSQPKYSVTLDLDGGSGVSVNDFINNGNLVKPNGKPTKDGHVFQGWFYDKEMNEEVEFDIVIVESLYIYAGWITKTAEATFVLGSWTDEIVKAAEDGVFTPPITEREGYVFKGWYADAALQTEADFEKAAASDATFYAKWELEKYEINYDTDGLAAISVNARTEYTVEDTVNLVSPVKIKSGYEFLYWLDEEGEQCLYITRGATGNRTFKGVFLSRNNFVEKVVGGSVDSDKIALNVKNSLSEIDLTEYLTVSDRASFGVFSEEEELSGSMGIEVGQNEFTLKVTAESGEIKEYALIIIRYSAEQKEFAVVFPDGDRTSVSVDRGDLAKEPDRKKINGREFENWYGDAEFKQLFDFNTAITEDTEIYAKYGYIQYKINYFTGIGKENPDNPDTYTMEKGVVFADAIAPQGYKFVGWFTDAAFTTETNGIADKATGEVTVYAQYELIEKTGMMEKSFYSGVEITFDRLPDLFNWAVFNRLEQFDFTVTDHALIVAEIQEVLSKLEEKARPVDIIDASLSSVNNNYTVRLSYSEPDRTTDGSGTQTQLSYNVHSPYKSVRGENFDAFKINSVKDTVAVADTQQLYHAAESGYRPIPKEGSAAERIYNAAKQALRQIVDDGMTDIEKAHAIYDWLVLKVDYDFDLLTVTENNHYYNGFYLEGVFDDDRAVCDGISKTYVLMCRIEGIECVRVVGHAIDSGVGHAWNKILIDGKWYIVDATNGNKNFSEVELLDHYFFMITDEKMAKYYVAESRQELAANTDYDVYSQIAFSFNGTKYDLKAENVSEIRIFMSYFIYLNEVYNEAQTFEFTLGYEVNAIAQELSSAAEGIGFEYGYIYDENRNTVVFINQK